jgi:hypothetical protein
MENTWRIVKKGKQYRMRDGALTEKQLNEQGFTIIFSNLTRENAYEKYTEFLNGKKEVTIAVNSVILKKDTKEKELVIMSKKSKK